MIASPPSDSMSSFDPYLKWLGIRDPQRPPNHYRLLGIEPFESDPDVISSAADRQMSHLRKYQHGQHAELSQRLLNEVAAAKLCLLKEETKSAYDERLGSQVAHGSAFKVDAVPRIAPRLPVAGGRVLIGAITSRRRPIPLASHAGDVAPSGILRDLET